MIANKDQMQIALNQLSSFKNMLVAMQLHLENTKPGLITLVSESYHHRIHEIQAEICDYLLQQQDTTLPLAS